ncbi:MAG: AGE family epimerase/isomerase [Paludibacteraceae bacterium]|nr:AGE family epimerase/isomerase [Paludibacteraceae bacterium]
MSKCVNLRAEAQALLETNILRFWQERMVDYQQGGFYGRIDGYNVLHPDAEKGAVLNARILWTFSAAARVLHNTPYRILAARAYDYLVQRFIDREQGGVYWSLNADGTPLDTKKQTYAIAFAIYGLVEYYRATQDSEALNAAIRLFEDLEAHAYKCENAEMSKCENEKMGKCGNGYVEALTRDWQPIADMRLSEKDENGVFTMNTHLHVLEAYTNLYRVLKNVQRDDIQGTKERITKQLRTLIDIFANRIFDPATGHLMLFFDESWQPSNTHTSPGHDIEAAWLLHEALEVLGDEVLLNQTLPVIHSLAQAAEEGIMEEKEWWCFAEAVVGYLDQWKLYQREKPVESNINLELAETAFLYIQNCLIDRENGEWFWSVLPDGTPDRTHDKAGFWKCPYHNSRMCIEIMERLNS